MKRLLWAGFAAVALLQGGTAARAQSPVVDGEVIGTTDLVKAACAEGALTYYTAQSDDDERAIAQPFAKRFPCIRVSVISAVTGRLYERMQTEAQAGKVVGDVAMLTDESLARELAEKKLIRPWNAPLAAAYPASSRQDGWFYAASGTFMMMTYNTDLVEKNDAPKAWQDLVNPKWKGKLVGAPITIGGSAWYLYAYLREAYGHDFLVKLAAQQPAMMPSYNPVATGVARGEYLVGLTASLNEYAIRIGQGAPLQPVYPADGVPFVSYPMMLLANAPHPAAGELFANWYMSREGQAALVKQRGAYSLRTDVPAAKENPPLSSIHVWTPGLVTAERRNAMIEEWGQVFGAR